jgi:hypothetical protein
MATFIGMYGISTVTSQIESIFFLSNKLPRGMIRAVFIQGAIGTALFAPLAVLVLGKWREAKIAVGLPAPAQLRATSVAWKLALLVVAFVFRYMFFGYFVAWQNPELRKSYGGPDWPTFFAAIKGNWQNSPLIFPLASFRALLFVTFMCPLIRMLRGSMGTSHRHGAVPGVLDHRAATARPVDACQRGAQPFLGNAGV